MGNPDIFENDGIYSAYYIPDADGPHKISITVQNENSAFYFDDREEIPEIISNECSDPYCDYDAVEVVDKFYRSVDLALPILFKNRDVFREGRCLRILDLKVKALPNAQVEVGFTSPWILGSNKKDSADYYEIQYGGSPNELLKFQQEGNSTVPRISYPGLLEMYTINIENHPGLSRLTYFTVQSFKKDNVSGELLSSELSNIGVAWTTRPRTEELPENVELIDPLFTSTGIFIMAGIIILVIVTVSVTACVLCKFRTESINVNAPV